MMNKFFSALGSVYRQPVTALLSISLSLNLLAGYYLIFLQTTTFAVFFNSNNNLYNWLSIAMTLVNSWLFGIAITLVSLVWQKRQAQPDSMGNSVLGAVFGAISSGCPVCGAWLLPMLGIAGSLAAFPLQGLEIKALSILLLGLSIQQTSQTLSGSCNTKQASLLRRDKNYFVLRLDRKTLLANKSLLIGLISVLIVYYLPQLPAQFRVSFAATRTPFTTNSSETVNQGTQNPNTTELLNQINPPTGYTLKARYGDVGPKILQAGAIDLERFQQLYQRSGQPLTSKQLAILTQGLDEPITITKQNSYFLLNFFWALGLTNKNPILDQGEMTKYGQDKIGSFASTGGWTLGTKPATELYSQTPIIKLTPEQQKTVQRAAEATYRPCCSNPTSFPDCNHGMAMLGLFQLMAAQGASEEELLTAAKYFNAFWFPQQYLDIATYFQAKEGKTFAQIDPRLVVSEQFSSGRGWSNTRKWLANNNLIQKSPNGGGGCGV